jgi:hypothetical protein
MPDQFPYRLGSLLVCRGIITEEQLSTAVLTQRSYNPPKPLGRVLVDLGYVHERDLRRCLKRQRCIRWYAAVAALISAPSAAYGQDLSIEDYPQYQHTKVAELDNEGFHLDAEGHYQNRTDPDIFITSQGSTTLSGSLAVTAAMQTAAKLLWRAYSPSDEEKTQFDFAVAASSKGYGLMMSVNF